MTPESRWSLRRVFRLPQTTKRVRRELDDELRFHLDGRIEELIEREGLSRTDAERDARRRFGDYEAYRNEARHIDEAMLERRNKMELLDAIRRESRHALRSLMRAPSFSLIALLTLALGLGATTAIFTLVDRVVLRPLPYPNADRLIRINTLWPGLKPGTEYGLSSFMFFHFKQVSRTLDDLGIYVEDAAALPAINGVDAERAPAIVASPSLLNVLGIHPEIGRAFNEDDQQPQAHFVVLLTHALWMRRYGGDKSIVGRSIDVGSGPREVIGVLPATADLPGSNAALWLPLRVSPSDPPRNMHTYKAIGLMKRGERVEHVVAELGPITHQITVDYPNTYGDQFMKKTGFGIGARSLRDDVVGPRVAQVLWIIFASVGLVLLIAAANVANLFLVRIDARRRELVVRSALGADRAHLAAHYLAESCILAGAAAVGAVALAWTLLHVGLRMAPSMLPRLAEVSLDWQSVAFCVGLALLAGVFFGLLPLVQSALDLQMLRDGGRTLTSSRTRNAARRILVVSQVALAVVLLASAGLLVRSFARLHAVRPGFETSGVLTVSIILPQRSYPSEAQLVGFWRDLSKRVEALPGVSSVGSTDMIPLRGDQEGCTGMTMLDSRLEQSQWSQCLPTRTVAPGYFRAMGIPIRGRAPDWSDDQAGSGNMVVSRAFAEHMWPGESAIGKRIVYSVRRRLEFTVIGIAEDVRANGLQKPPLEMAYFPTTAPVAAGPSPYVDMDITAQTLVVRSSADDLQALGAKIRQIVTQMDPRVPIASVEPMDVIVANSIAQTSFTMALLGLSAIIALGLSAAGIYGVISYVVGQRRAEIGIRMALGARAADVSRMVVGESVRMATLGVVAGIVGALLSARLLRSLLFEVSPNDPFVLAMSCLVLLAVTAGASFGPARRATRIDPVEAMRT